MDVLSKARSTHARRLCVRVAVAIFLIVFSVGDAVERGLASHGKLDEGIAFATLLGQSASISTDHSGIHVDVRSAGDPDVGGQALGHGCHGCAAIAEPMIEIAASPISRGSPHAWASVPSTAGREPLIDLPPPRA